MSVVSVLELHVLPGREEAFARRFCELAVFERSRESGGFLGGRLLRPLGQGSTFVVVAEWDSPGDYQAWLASALRAQLAAELEPMLTGAPAAGRLFEEA
ncbi:MAG TPA: antibiotic biosynthesis monooxygenase family protein [Gaiellaceae bacterium]|nr:antibiotic biosynthesis monooxygenase family protein [Gaiellaceae bacterium]